MILSTDPQELKNQLENIRTVAQAATPGPWVVGDQWHVQGETHCNCARYGKLIFDGPLDINGEVMRAHVHELEEAWWPYGLYTEPDENGEYFNVLYTTQEYGHPAKEDLILFGLMNPETVLSMVDTINNLLTQLSTRSNNA